MQFKKDFFVHVNRLAKRSVKPFRALGVVMKHGGEFSFRSKVAATTAAVVLTVALGVVDYLTGRELVISVLPAAHVACRMGSRALVRIDCGKSVHVCVVPQ